MEFNRYLINLARRWLWLLILAPIIAGAITYWVRGRQPTVYEASARLLIGPGIDSPNPNSNDFKAGGQLMHTYAEVATTRPFLQSISDDLHLGIGPDSLGHKIEVKPNDETQVLTIHVQDRDPDKAVAIANALANALVRLSPTNADRTYAQLRDQMRAQAVQLQADIESSEARIKQLEADYQAAVTAASQAQTSDETLQLVSDIKARIDKLEADLQAAPDLATQRLLLDQIALGRSRLSDLQSADLQVQRLILDQLDRERTRLSDAHKTLALLNSSLESTFTNQVKLVEAAVSGTPAPSQTQLEVLMSSLAGLILALAIALAYEYFNDAIQATEDLAQTTGVPVLGSLANDKVQESRGSPVRLVVRAWPTSRAAENYRLLSTRLLPSMNGSSACHVVLVSSLHRGDNTSEIAANLAVTLAQIGRRVVLVDANLREPLAGQLFGVADRRGLADLLADLTVSPEGVTFDWAPGLFVIPSYAVSSNPFGLLASPRMVDLLEQLKQRADIVIIAAAPLLSFAESLVLASHVDGVLLVARSGETSRKEAGKAIESLRALGAHVLGFILNDGRRGMLPFAPQIGNRRGAGRGLADLGENIRELSARTIHRASRVALPVVSSQTVVPVPTADGQSSREAPPSR